MTTKAQMRGMPEPQEEQTLEPETQAEIAANEQEQDQALPAGTTEEPDGSWLYTLQHPLEPTKDDPDGKDVGKVRIPARVMARHVRDADQKGTGAVDTMMALLSSMSGVPKRIIERMDYRDFSVLQTMVSRRTSGLPQ